MKFISSSIILIFTLVYSECSNIPISPCPDVFTYKNDKERKYGIISISGKRDKTILEATLAFHDAVNHDDPGELDFIKNFEKTKDDARNGRNILYKLVFPESENWPIITDISLNNESICEGPKVTNMNKWHYSKEFDYPKGPVPKEENPISPCENVFSYKTHQRIKYGIIAISGRRDGKTTKLTATLGIYEPFNESDTGALYFYRSYNRTLEDLFNGKAILYKLRFPQDFQYWPIIEKITLDGNEICSGPESDLNKYYYEKEFKYPKGNRIFPEIPSTDAIAIASTINNIPPSIPKLIQGGGSTRSATTSTTTSGPILIDVRMPSITTETTPDDPSWLLTSPMRSTCGKRLGFNPENTFSALIIGGKTVEIGEFPWMVAMFTMERRKSSFFCGGNLISTTHVITAAHCVKDKSKILLEFGKHDLSRTDEDGYIVRVSSGIVAHPEYAENSAHADIAVVFFEPITFSHTIRPICLWQFGTTFDFIRKKGTITGWGRAEQGGDNSELPNKLEIERVDKNLCRNSHTLLRTLATDKTFCAGGDNSGPCQGDSGSGFYVHHGNTWYLRGVISTSVGNIVACHVDKYAVYVDVIYYLEWIQHTIT